MTCQDPSVNCVIRYENSQNFVIRNNRITNGILVPKTVWQEGTVVDHNHFVFTRSASQRFDAISIGAQILGNTAAVTENVITSNAPQPAGSECIHIESGPPQYAPGKFVVQGNTCDGSNPFPVSLNMINFGQTGGASFVAVQNSFSGQVLHSDKAGNGHFNIQR